MSDLTIQDFFCGSEDARQLFDAVASQVKVLGDVTISVSKSQIAFRRSKNFVLAWIPGQYIKNHSTAPLVLTFSFQTCDPSPRWKEITMVGPKRFTHHLELHQKDDIDEEVLKWLQVAWEQAA